MALTQNRWGFSVARDNPFEIFPYLQQVAKKAVDEEMMIDLSRGDPGYHFAPSRAGREFFGYLLFLDSHLNSWEQRFSTIAPDGIWKKIVDYTKKNFPHSANHFLHQWDLLFTVFGEIGRTQNLDTSQNALFTALFRNSIVSGGSYLDPAGQPLFRAAVAWHHSHHFSEPVDYHDLIFVNGASHAIGTLFKAFGREGNGYLQAGNRVVIASPVYAPYNDILRNRGLSVISLSLDPVSGVCSERSLNDLSDSVAHCGDDSGGRVKMIISIDPNNPTGTSAPERFLQKLAEFAEQHNALIVTDEVYSDFFPSKKTLIDLCPKRVIRIHARSKIERSTGLRFGDMLINKQAQQFLSEQFGVDIMRYLINAKAPGGIHGEFFHTTFVPGPVQVLGILHILLGQEDRSHYLATLEQSRTAFYKILSLPHRGNMYYSIFDLNAVSGCVKQSVPIEEKLLALAQRGVIYIPAYLFFDERDRSDHDLIHMVRASFVNASPENVRRAAEITREYLCRD